MSAILNGRGAADILAASLDASPVNVAVTEAGQVALATLDASATPVLLGLNVRSQSAALTLKVQSSNASDSKTVLATWLLDDGETLVLSARDLQSIRGAAGEALELDIAGTTPKLYGCAWVASDIRI